MDVIGQLKTVTFQTGTFLVAWSWVLVYYAISHVAAGESPLEDQIGFGGHGKPQKIFVLMTEYVVVCGITVLLLERLHATGGNEALAGALAFFPSPVFSGKLLQFLGQFSSNGFNLALLNVLTTAVVAAAVHAAPRTGRFGSLGDVMRDTVGFGLGVSWNVLVSRSEPAECRLAARTVYLGVVLLLAARLAAPPPSFDSLKSRIAALLSFAVRVVCAFALADWLKAALPPGPFYGVLSLVGLVAFAAQMGQLLAAADLERAQAVAKDKAAKQGWGSCLLRALVFVPCVWCCCPWVPILWLLKSGIQGTTGRWTELAADVCSLAASVVGTGLLTGAIDSAAAYLQICQLQGCDVFQFLTLEVAFAALTSIVLLPLLNRLTQGHDLHHPEGDVEGVPYVLVPPPEPGFVVR